MPYGSRIEYDNRENAAERQVAAKLRWLPMEELDAECDSKPSTELTEALKRTREKMAEEANSEEAEQKRWRDASAVSQFLQQPVVYSQRR